ncbi:MAG: hypothetical protein V2A79_04080 [Planctomycetota bacterium]
MYNTRPEDQGRQRPCTQRERIRHHAVGMCSLAMGLFLATAVWADPGTGLPGPAARDSVPVDEPAVCSDRWASEPVHLSAEITPLSPAEVAAASTPTASRGLRDTIVVTYSDQPFEGTFNGTFPPGMVATEIAAATYNVAAIDFPILLNMSEMIWAQNHFNPTTTAWSYLVWDGEPNTGTLVASFSSDGIILPHVQLPVGGSQAVNLQVTVDPGDPEQIIIYDTGGTHKFSVGFRIDAHNNPPISPCSCPLGTLPAVCCPPQPSSNAWPAMDAAGPAYGSLEWLWARDCPGGSSWCFDTGWFRLSTYPEVYVNDWAIRVTYTPLGGGPTGACCHADTSCTETTESSCTSGDGIYQGDGTTCSPTNPCLTGACCHADQTCTDDAQYSSCQTPGDTFYSAQTCAQVGTCPEPVGACCQPGQPGNCVNGTTETVCTTSLGGTWVGPGSDCYDPGDPCMQACCFLPSGCVDLEVNNCALADGFAQGPYTACATTVCFPSGACCYLDGSCDDDVPEADCTAAGGTFKGDGVLCASVSCPQPYGACCLSSGNCIYVQQASCLGIPNAHWAGPFTTCFTGLCPLCDSGDANQDGHVDLEDFARFQFCFLGLDGGTGPCKCLDIDHDNDVDLNDYKLFRPKLEAGGP